MSSMSKTPQDNEWVIQILRDYADTFGLNLLDPRDEHPDETGYVVFVMVDLVRGYKTVLISAACHDLSSKYSRWEFKAFVDTGSKIVRHVVSARDLQIAAATGVPLHGLVSRSSDDSLQDTAAVKNVLSAYAETFELKLVNSAGVWEIVDDKNMTVLYAFNTGTGWEIRGDVKRKGKTNTDYVSLVQLKAAIAKHKRLDESCLIEFIRNVLTS